jgi:molecular chaperone GrpE (heat shock protein)
MPWMDANPHSPTLEIPGAEDVRNVGRAPAIAAGEGEPVRISSAAAGPDAAPAPTPESAAPAPDPIAVLSASLLERLHSVEVAISDRLAASDRSGAVIDRLHEEVQRSRQRQDARRMEPGLRALVRLSDDLRSLVDAARREGSTTTRDELVRSLENFRLQVEEVLYREGADSFAPELGTPFDGKRQQVIAVVPVEDTTRDRAIMAVRQPGYVFDERVLRPALVDVGRYSPPPTTDRPLDPGTAKPTEG